MVGVRRRSRSLPSMILLGVAAAAAVGIGWWVAMRLVDFEPVGIAPTAQQVAASEKRMVYLYFGDAKAKHLVAEQRVMDKTDDRVAFGRQLVQSLIKGPLRGASRTLPADAQIRSFFIDETKTAFIDFEKEAFKKHPGGVSAEYLSIYSIVNTLVLNVEGIRKVKFLIGGTEVDTLAGHVALREPFEVDMLWVR